jgi:thioredoxin-like negative regulator of GroEL
MVERAVLAAGFIVLASLAGYLMRQWSRRRSQALAGTALPTELATRLTRSAGGIVYFYGPHCATCRRQAGVLDSLSNGDRVSVLQVDASRETELADHLGVMTVPATVVVDESRQVHAVNLGFRSADVLRGQLKLASDEHSRARASA